MELTFPSQGSKYLKLEKESNAGGGQDMISKMPDCILSYILSFLPTKQIIQTALLSRRWQYLWTSISNIDLYDESSIQSKSSFLDFVERVLLLHDASDIKRFRLNICVSVNPSRINSWVSTVVMHKVQELHLSLPYKISFRLPCCLFTCASLAFLKLDMDLLVVPTSVELPRLKRLDLFGVMFPDDNSIERFLSKCPVLEELNFRNCGWVNTKRITIFIPSLREFTIYNDFYPLGLLDCTIEIYASNLVSLSYESDLRVNCLLQDLPSSVDASIDLFYAREERTSSARRLFDCFLNVKSLTLTGGTLQYLPLVDNLATQHIVARLPTFINMTTLEVNLAVSTSTTELVMGFLQNTPNLQLLVVNFTEIEIDHEFTEDWDHEVVPSCFGSCLKTINTYCFDGYEEDVYLVKFLLKKTTVLERMSIYCTGAFWSNSEKQEQEMKRGNNMDPTFQLHCSKHQKLEKESNDGEDRISNLPDCILCSILSLLPTKDTIQTSILSKRWRHLWVSMPNIDLDDKFMSKLSFADIVERVLLLHDASDIKIFRLSFTVPFIRFRFYSWVFAALKHRVQELDLSLPIRTNYLLPRCLFTSKSLTVLKIAMDLDLDVPTFMGLPSLKRLNLKMVTFSDEESFEQLISSCPMLQDLTFRDCNWVNIRKATIYVPSLKRFTLTYDDLPEPADCTIIIYASNLAFLEYDGNLRVTCLLYNLPFSVNASVDFMLVEYSDAYRAIAFLNCFANIKSLAVTNNTLWLPYEDHIAARGLTLTFNKLSTLTMILDINSATTDLMMDFLQRSPTVDFLAIQLRDVQEAITVSDADWDQEMVPSCLKSRVKTISISGFDGSDDDMHIVKVLLKKATVMEGMIIHCNNSTSWSDPEKQKNIQSQLHMLPRGTESCVIELVKAIS